MEIYDIQINDYFLYDEKIVQVKSIIACENNDVLVKYHEDKYGKYGKVVPSSALKPIYLTDEILVKNSISASKMPFGGWVYCLMENEFNEVHVQLRTDSIWKVRIEHLEGNFINLIYVCTVHEFQHALRLCGIEKKIEL